MLHAHFGDHYQSRTLYDEQATAANVAQLKNKLLDTHIDDIVIVAYSGHGVLSQDLDYYLSTYNGMDFQKDPIRRGFPMTLLENLLDSILSCQKLLLMKMPAIVGSVDKDELRRPTQQGGSLDMQNLLASAKKRSS